jgi:hypothetical protein
MVDSEKANRHSLLKQCKMESINIPMRKGGLDEVDDDGGDDPSIEVRAFNTKL